MVLEDILNSLNNLFDQFPIYINLFETLAVGKARKFNDMLKIIKRLARQCPKSMGHVLRPYLELLTKTVFRVRYH